MDQAAAFTYAINWGDGSTQAVTGPASQQVGPRLHRTGTFTVRVTATDKNGGVSASVQQTITIKAVDLQGATLAVGGTTNADDIVITPNDAQGNLKVTISGAIKERSRRP